MKADPPAGCKELGVVLGKHGDSDSQQAEMRNKAAEMGANYVRWDAVQFSGSSGTAYACPQ